MAACENTQHCLDITSIKCSSGFGTTCFIFRCPSNHEPRLLQGVDQYDLQARPARTKQLEVKGLEGLAEDVFCNDFLMKALAETIDLLA